MNVLRFFEIIVSTSKSINVRQIVRESIDSCNVTNISFGVDIKNRFSRGIHLSQRKVKSGGIRSSWRLHISNFRDINTNERQDPRSRTGNTSCVGGTLVHRSCRWRLTDAWGSVARVSVSFSRRCFCVRRSVERVNLNCCGIIDAPPNVTDRNHGNETADREYLRCVCVPYIKGRNILRMDQIFNQQKIWNRSIEFD